MTRILVLIKDIPDLSEIKIDPSTRHPLTDSAKRRINDLDKRALEAAVKLKESSGAEVVTLSLGDEKTKTCVLEALAIGADISYVVNWHNQKLQDAQVVCHVLSNAIQKIGVVDLVLAGELSLDRMGSQIGPMIAENLRLPLVTYIKEIKIESGKVKGTRDLEDVDEFIEVELPALITVVREINEPRIPSLMNIMKAKKKPLIEWNLEFLGLTESILIDSLKVKILNVEAPLVKRKKIVVKAEKIEEVANKLIQALAVDGVLE